MKKVLFVCMECGRKFTSVKSAEKAAWDGCPKCGGVDIDTPEAEATASAVDKLVAHGEGGGS